MPGAQQLNEDQIQELRDIVAWRLMGNDVTDEQAKWRDDAIMRSQSTSLIERRVRMALGTGDRRGLNTWLARLPMEAKEKDEWRYWQADLLLNADVKLKQRDFASTHATAWFLPDGCSATHRRRV